MERINNYYKKLIDNNNLIFLLSIFILILSYKYNLLKFPEAANGPLMPWDGGRYLRPDNLQEMFNEQYFITFPFYYYFVGIFKKYNFINLIPIVQFLIFHFSCFFLFRRISKIYSANIGFISWIIIILNPIFFKWCHAVNPLIITISLCAISLSLLLSKKNKTIITFVILLLLLKNDAKLILNYLIFNYFFLKKIFKNKNIKIFIILLFVTFLISIHHISILNSSTSNGFITSAASLEGHDIIKQGAELIFYKKEMIDNCSITQMNSIKNHLCMMANYPKYSLELYSKRLIYGLLWISPSWSIQYQIISKMMLLFYYFFLLFGLKNKNNVFLLVNFIAPFILTLPYILDGDQRFVTFSYIFLTPLTVAGLCFFLKKYFKFLSYYQ
jgi:hypothetical protein